MQEESFTFHERKPRSSRPGYRSLLTGRQGGIVPTLFQRSRVRGFAPASRPACGPRLAFKGVTGINNSMRMKQSSLKWAALSGLFIGFGALLAQDGNLVASYTPVDIHESFSAVIARMTAAKPEIMRRHTALLEQRHDLTDPPAQGVRHNV